MRPTLPAPALVLVAAALAAELVPSLHHLSHHTNTHIVSVALALILFNGGLQLGLRRVRAALAPILLAGLPGTFLTAIAAAAIAHLVCGWSWWVSLLLGTAVAPTDPAVVFSVLGKREVEGRAGTILEGESGANDPVGIAVMSGLLSAGGVSAHAFGSVAGTFVLQMAVGAAVGVLGGRLLLLIGERVTLPRGVLYPLLTLAVAMLAYGVAVGLHGSGFLAVFLAGIVLGDSKGPYQQEIVRLQGALAGLAELVAFVVLGLTVDLATLGRVDVWGPGLGLAVALALVVRPLAVGLCLAGVDLPRRQLAFVLWAGLKGAVPLLLGSFLLTAPVPDPQRLYGVVVVVVAFSVVVQGGLVPLVARRLQVPMRMIGSNDT